MAEWTTHRVFVAPGHEWSARDSREAKPGKQTLVFIHGRFSSHHNWASFAEHYRRNGHRVITYDLDGHGASTGDGTLNLKQHADGLRTVLDHLGVRKAVLIGHSDGGVIAQQFAHDHPDRSLGLVLVNSYHRLPEDTKTMIEMLIELNEQTVEGMNIRHRLSRQLLKLRALNLLTEGRFGPREILHLFNPRNPGKAKVLINHSRAFNNAVSPPVRGVPVLALHTDRDFLVGQKPVDDFSQIHDDLQSRILKMTTHVPHVREPAWVREHVDRFLSGRAQSV